MMTRHSHIPALGKHQPVTTYRLQMTPEFTFADAEAIAPYLKDLGVSDVYFSPILQAAPGSMHGYDVVDHRQISADLGGREAFESASRAIHELGMHVVVDVVPNHMAVPTPLYLNYALWSVLQEGPNSPYAAWFDLELTDAGEGVLMPVLGDRIGAVLARGELTVETIVIPGHESDGEVSVLRYFDHVFPIRPGTESLPLAELVDMQYYRLAYWKVANEELNYRRFFDVDTLVAVRVEDDDVFSATHALLLEEMESGYIDGFRIDHPDGLADPREYLRKLHKATDGAWIVAEKILEGDELLPSDWPCSGTTGYDALQRIQGVLVDPAGLAPLTSLYVELTGSTETVANTQIRSKREIVATSLFAEVDRLANLVADICHADVRLRDHTFRTIRTVIAELAIQMDRYRAYVVPGETPTAQDTAVLRGAASRARNVLDADAHDTLDLVTELFLGNEIGSAGRTNEAARHEVIIRFQQLCGPVMAKGVEDTTFYRYTALTALNEVGAGPDHPVCTPDQFHSWAELMHDAWPASAVTLTTHDTKRGEDVRARIAVLTQYAREWEQMLRSARQLVAANRPQNLDAQMENLLWQTLIGTWGSHDPISPERLQEYLMKAAREQKSWTTWTEQNEAGEAAMLDYLRVVLSNVDVMQAFEDFATKTIPAVRQFILGQVTLRATAFGVADIYQGEEITRTSLVDPDNRRTVDYAALTEMLATIQENGAPSDDIDAEKLWVVSQLAHLRNRNPWLASATGSYQPLPVTTGHALAFVRSEVKGEEETGKGAAPAQVVSVVTRLYASATTAGVIGQHSVVLPEGEWLNVLTGERHSGGEVKIATLVGRFPVAVLEKA